MVSVKAENSPFTLLSEEYSYAYWMNSWRSHKGEQFPDVLCFETGSWGMMLDIDDLTKPRFGILSSPSTLRDTLGSGLSRIEGLPEATLSLEVEHDGQTYKLVGCSAADEEDSQRLNSVWMWESGTIAQHFEIHGLILKNDSGKELIGDCSLDMVAWPGSLTLNARVSPAHRLKQGPSTGITGTGLCIETKPFVVPGSEIPASPEFSVEMWTRLPESLAQSPVGWLLCNKQHEGADGNFGFTVHNNHFAATMNIGGGRTGRQQMRSKGYLDRNKWYQLILTFDGKTATFYLNGTKQESVEFKQPRNPGTESILLGRRGNKTGDLCKGLYDQVRLWKQALTAKEIRSLYQKPAAAPLAEDLVINHDFGTGYRDPVWKNSVVRLSLNTADGNWSGQKSFEKDWQVGQVQEVTMTTDVNGPVKDPALALTLTTADGKVTPLSFTPDFNSYSATLKESSLVNRNENEVRDYDEVVITVENKGDAPARVPVYLHLGAPASITGLVPLLCHEDGTPTGIPVQLSKNWHYPSLGSYLRPYMILPAKKGVTKYKLRVVYGFYGALPSASHAQLSLVGYANNSRWDQLAIGCFGETICFDVDMACVPNAITDIRGLMLRNGVEGKKWGWNDCGWGGNWLHVPYREKPEEGLYFSQLKTAYLAQGPCLTDVRYDGYYGVNHEVDFEGQVQTLRTYDFARTFQNLTYTFQEETPVEGVSFFAIGARAASHTPRFAYGDKNGIHAEVDVPPGVSKGHVILDKKTIGGEGPWWISLPESRPAGHRTWGTGCRALIVRRYEAIFSGKTYRNPTITIPVSHDLGKGDKTVQILLTPPPGVTSIQPGDKVSMDVELITLPRVADDYYGPNVHFRNILTAHPNSWFPAFREAMDNDLDVTVSGGELLRNYPVMIKATDPEITVTIEGGAGAVPVRFEGLTEPSGYHLYQIIDGTPQKFENGAHGNDFWQCIYNTKSQTYEITYNLPLDNTAKSTWKLTRKAL